MKLSIGPGYRTAIFAAALCGSAFAIDLTFFAVSDVHFGQNSVTKDANRTRMPNDLNTLPGKTYPASAGGGIIGTPRGVLIPGDLIEVPDTALWRQYVADYGVNGEGRVRFPVYDGLGNHDAPGTSTLVTSRHIARNQLRQGLTMLDSTNYHYSWDWDGVHFVNINLYFGSGEIGYSNLRPLYSMQFLQSDLALHVGTSGRPVILMQHYPYADTTWWTSANKAALYNILRNYNVVAVINGHSHAKVFYKWNGLDAIDDGTVMNGDIVVFHITDNRLLVVNRINDLPGTLIVDKTISMGTVGVDGPANARSITSYFSITGTGFTQQVPGDTRALEITDLFGRTVRRLTASSPKILWDRRDNREREVSSGIFFLRAVGSDGKFKTIGKFVLKSEVR